MPTVSDLVQGSGPHNLGRSPEVTVVLVNLVPTAPNSYTVGGTLLWAYDPNGINQVGCIYTAQGFEFDFVGVIFGTDLVYRRDQGWMGQKDKSHDRAVRGSGERFLDLLKNTYRVLMTRGILGCYMCFQDKETENFLRSRLETVKAD